MEDKKEYITEKDRPRLVRDFDYGEVVTNGWEEIDLPKMSEVEYSNSEKVYENYEKLDLYISEIFIPTYVRMKKNNNPYNKKGEMYPSIQLNHIVDLRLSHDEMQHVIYYLDELGIRIGGISPTLDYDIPNYDYVTTFKSKTKEEYKKDHEEELKMFEELRKPNNNEIRDKLILNNMRLAEYLAYKYSMIYHMDYDEIESYAYEGLIYSVDNFDYTLGNKFSTYAYPCIKGIMLKGIGEMYGNGKTHNRNLFYQVKPFVDAIQETEGKTIKDDPKLIEDVLDLMRSIGKITNYSTYNLYRMVLMSNLDISLEDNKIDQLTDGGIEEAIENAYLKQLNAKLYPVMNTLTEREQLVLIRRFGLDGNVPKTLEETALEIGVTRERIRQIEAKALRKLRHPNRSKRLREYVEN